MKFGAATHSDQHGPNHSTRSSVRVRSNLAPKPSKLLSLCLLLFFSTGSALALDPSHLLSQYGHTAWRIHDGYFGGAVVSIAQTADGYLWIGTENGLFRFDGVRFVPFTQLTGQKEPAFITSLLAARDGSLWIATGHGLSHWLNSKLINLSVPPAVQSIVEDENGVIWFIHDSLPGMTTPRGHLCRVIGVDTRCYGAADGIPDMRYNRLATDTRGNVWIAGSSALVRWNPASSSSTVYTTKAMQSPSHEGQPGIIGLAANPDGSMWVGMGFRGPGGGLQQLVGEVWKPFRMPELDGTSLVVCALLFDREGSLWIGTCDQGIYRVHGSTVEHSGSAEGLTSDTGIFKFYEDREGNLWVATAQGLDLFRDKRVATFSSREGLGTPEVDGVMAARDGTVWISGAESLDALRKDGVTSIRRGKGLPGSQVTSLFEDHTGQLWVGIDNKLYVYKDGTFGSINKNDGSPTGMVVGIAEDIENNIWIETLRNSARILLRIHDFKVQEEFPAPQMPAARRVVADPKSGIWLGLLDGNLARVRNGQAEIFHFQGSAKADRMRPIEDVEQMTITPDGAVLGATGFGLIGWKNGNQRILNARNGLPCDGVHAALTDSAGNLWVYAQCGLVEIAAKDVQEWWENSDIAVQPSLVLDVFDGAQANRASFPGAARSVDGRLWFSNGYGLQMIDPAHLAMKSAPPVHVEEIIADRKQYSPQEGLRIPPRTRDLEIDYTALSLAVPQKVRFRYKLEGRDNDWQDPGTRRQAFYTDLRPRKYTFRVIACGSDGVWNEAGASLAFSVAPAWYQTIWFLALCILAGIVVVWSAYRLRVRQVAKALSARFDERLAERTRIARELHDTLLQSFHGALFRFQALRNMLPRRPEEASEALDGAILRAEQAIGESRDAIKDLRSESAAQADLAELLTATCKELTTAHGKNGDAPAFRVVVEGEPRNLAPILQEEIYRIAREVLRNAFQHASARNVEAEIRYGDQVFRLRIRDDGKGIDPQVLKEGNRPGHWGMPGIRERAQRIGAQLDFWSEAGAGTEVQINVPSATAYETSHKGWRFALFRSAKSNE